MILAINSAQKTQYSNKQQRKVQNKNINNSPSFKAVRILEIEFAEKLSFFLQTLGNGFKSGYVLSRT